MVELKQFKLPRRNNFSEPDTHEEVLTTPITPEESVEIHISNNRLMIIGSNGSGKTRLGSWIENNWQNGKDTHRISAQKSLIMTNTTSAIDPTLAMNQLYLGENFVHYTHLSPNELKRQVRWQQKPNTHLLDDFGLLLQYLFSEQTDINHKYSEQSWSSNEKVLPIKSKLKQLQTIWEKILPHRKLIVEALKIQVTPINNMESAYSPEEMSDGERVIFYLIGQCLAAPKNGIIIIDEPELHLHKAIQQKLWFEIEQIRSDCIFVYITHDVEFVASMGSATKLWVKDYDGNTWDWEIINSDQNTVLPESLLLELLGNRKPIIFVEGTEGSYDIQLYRMLFKNHMVIPSGSCSKVIETVKGLNNPQQTFFRGFEVKGIIDRDRRSEEQIRALERDKIYTLSVAEVENLFCTPSILKFMSSQLKREPEDDLSNSTEFILNQLKNEKKEQISLHVSEEILFKLNTFNKKAKGQEELVLAAHVLTENLENDIRNLYQQKQDELDQVLVSKNLSEILKFYNRKSLAKQIGNKIFQLSNDAYIETFLRYAMQEDTQSLVEMLKPYFGSFPFEHSK